MASARLRQISDGLGQVVEQRFCPNGIFGSNQNAPLRIGRLDGNPRRLQRLRSTKHPVLGQLCSDPFK